MPLPASLASRGFGAVGSSALGVASGGGGGFGAIGGPLPFSGGAKDYTTAYNQALNFNRTNYNQILAGYNQTAAAQQAGQNQITQGYSTLRGDVLGGLAGIDKSQRQQIADDYAKQVGTESQRLISRGLGNSTVQQSIARGLMYDKAKADVDLTNRTQALNAQYSSQLGLAGLGYQGQALQERTGFANQTLQFLNSINAPYPDIGSYAALATARGRSGAGGGVGAGATTFGGAVQGPKTNPAFGNTGGGGFAMGGGFGGNTNPYRSSSGGTPQSVYPNQGYYPLDPADPAYDNGGYGGGTGGRDYDPSIGGYFVQPTAEQAGGLTSLPFGDGAPEGESEYYY